MEELLQSLVADKWVVAAVLGYMWWGERQERRDNAKEFRKERDEITQRIEGLVDALRELREKLP